MGLLDTLFSGRSFLLRNEDTQQELQGQFHAENLTTVVSSRYATGTSLNMANPFRQYISGELDTITFNATFFNRDEIFGSAQEDLELVQSWVRRDDKKKRPPICSFYVGDGHVSLGSCTIDKVESTFRPPTITGKLQGVVCSITITKYQAYTLDASEPGETRYHHAKDGDYYEMLTYIEYGNPEIGDIIRKRHPDTQNIKTGDIIKLPSIEAIRTEKVEQKSETFRTAYGKKDTPQRSLRIAKFRSRNVNYVSHIL